MKIHGTGNIVILLKVLFALNEENFALKLLLMMKGDLLKLLLDGKGEVACYQKAFQLTIPDSQGQVSSNKLNYRVYFIIEGGYNNEYK